MKKTAINSLMPYLKDSYLIGVGTTALCFLMKDGNVLKVFMDTSNKKELFLSKKNIIKHFELINKLKNDTYIVPEELLIKDNNFIGYIYPYKSAKVLNLLNKNTKLDNIIDSYDKLIEDTSKISEKKFILEDLHDKNILYSDNFYLIDLDFGYFEKSKSSEELTNLNLLNLNEAIIHSLFKKKLNMVIDFFDEDLNDLYKNATKKDYRYFKILLLEIQKYKDSIKSKSDLKKNKLIYTHNNYYRVN